MNEINPQQHQTYKWTTEKDKFAHDEPPVTNAADVANVKRRAHH
jgi:hypothetical protein